MKNTPTVRCLLKTVAAIYQNHLGSSENDTEDGLSHYKLNLRDRVLKLIILDIIIPLIINKIKIPFFIIFQLQIDPPNSKITGFHHEKSV